MSYGNFLADLQKVDDLIDPTVHNNNKNNNNNTNSKQQHSGNNANSNPKIVISSSSSTATLNDNVNGNSNNIGNSCSSLNTNININNNTSHTSTTSTSSNNNHITVDSLDQHQQLISLPETVGGAAIFLENDHHNSLSTTAAENTNFVAIPLSERPPVICISQDHHQQQHNHHHHQHDNYSESLTRSASCLLRLRRCCIKLFSKIMGSNNPSEVDRYEYYDYSELEEFETPARYRPDSLGALSRATRFTEDEIKRIYRGFKAECPTGVVKEDTFKLIYAQFFPQGANPTLYAHYVFNTLDQDHTGIVSFEDFVQGLSILSRGSVEEKLRWTFQLYDINGDGYITREEMTDIVTAIYELMGRLPDELPEEEKIKGKVERIFQKMDINRDGVVTLEEFLEACHNDEAISRSMSVFDSAF